MSSANQSCGCNKANVVNGNRLSLTEKQKELVKRIELAKKSKTQYLK